MPTKPKQNSLAYLSIVLAFLIPPIGLIVSIISLVQIKQRQELGKGLALAGLIISAVITFMTPLLIFAMLAYQA